MLGLSRGSLDVSTLNLNSTPQRSSPTPCYDADHAEVSKSQEP